MEVKTKGKEEAIRNSSIPDERKEFLISRLGYWDDFGRRDPRGTTFNLRLGIVSLEGKRYL